MFRLCFIRTITLSSYLHRFLTIKIPIFSDFLRQTILAALPRSLQSTTASSTDINSAICIYFKPISPGLIQPFVIINGEHICLQAASEVPENKPIFAVVDLFGVCKAVQVLPVKHSGKILKVCYNNSANFCSQLKVFFEEFSMTNRRCLKFSLLFNTFHR
jgi:hypothetical protein